jgi:hypothetical protein
MEIQFNTGAHATHSGHAPVTQEAATQQDDGQEQTEKGAKAAASSQEAKAGPKLDTELTVEEKRIVDQLRARDQEVRAHEQAHKAAAGNLAKGAPSFEYETGPDGRRYAVGGEVKIDTSAVSGNPEATLRKAQTIRRAANAPRNPSSQDRQVAAQAAQMEAQARQEINRERAEESKEAGGVKTKDSDSLTPQSSERAIENESAETSPPPKTPSATGNFLDIVL